MLSRQMKVGLGLLVGGLFVRALGSSKKTKRRAASATPTGSYPYPKPRTLHGVPFAQGLAVPAFPIAESASHNRRLDVSYKDVNGKYHGRWGRIFGADRRSGERYHAGIDLFGNPGDIVVAPEDGVVVATQNFLNSIDGSGPDAMLIDTDTGLTILLGEIDEQAFGVKVGDRVKRGQPIAKVQITDGGNHMLQVETYRKGVKSNQQWWKGNPAPSHLLDPTDYLLRAKAGAEKLA